jgi:hypothetical protein
MVKVLIYGDMLGVDLLHTKINFENYLKFAENIMSDYHLQDSVTDDYHLEDSVTDNYHLTTITLKICQ